jgi:hypothetical protein
MFPFFSLKYFIGVLILLSLYYYFKENYNFVLVIENRTNYQLPKLKKQK